MATGYTYVLDDRDDVSFTEFVWLCSRAFGARVMKRGDALDGDPPPPCVVGEYYVERHSSAAERLSELRRMSDDEIAVAAAEDYESSSRKWDELRAAEAGARARYLVMAESIRRWSPPTGDHAGLKRFMLEQIELGMPATVVESDRHSPRPVEVSPALWHSRAVLSATKDLALAVQLMAEESARVAKRNEWLDALRASLAEVE